MHESKTGQLVVTASLTATGMDSFCSTCITSANETSEKTSKEKKNYRKKKKYRFCFA